MTTRPRVRYRERQPLGADDLVAEQEFRLGQRHRHDRSQHRSGIASGLALIAGPSGVVVRPGRAIGGHGRTLVVARPRTVGFDVLDGIGKTVDVWLLDQECRTGARTADRAALRLTAAADTDPRQPDDAGTTGPVYLGRVTKGNGGYRVSAEHRTYAGLIGSSVVAPNGLARMGIDAAFAGDRRRFVVATGPDGRTERIRLDQDGQVHLTGDAVVDGPLRMAPHGAGLASGLGFATPAAPPSAPSPWCVYRAVAQGRDQLRFELQNPGTNGNPALHAFMIGRRAAVGFTPILTTSAQGSTTIRGRLSVLGGIVEGPVKPDISDPRLGALLYQTWSLANATAGLELDGRYRGVLAISIQPRGGPGPVPEAPFDVQVRNTGSVPLSTVILAISAVATPGPGQASRVLRFGTLAADAIASTSGTIQPSTNGKHTIEVTVVAVGRDPAQARVHDSVTLTWQVEIEAKKP